MKRIRPFPFDRVPRLARAQVDAGRALLAHLPLAPGPAWEGATAALGGPVGIALDEAYAFPARELGQRADAGVRVRITAPGNRHGLLLIDAALAPRLARRALGLDLSELAAPRPLSAIEQGALLFLVGALLDGGPLRAETIVAERADVRPLFPDPWVLALEVRLDTPVGGGWARILAPDRLRVAMPLARNAGEVLTAPRRARLRDAPIALRMEVGRTRIGRPELARLEAGDVVLFDHFGPRPPFGGPLSLRMGRGGWDAHLGGEGLTILGAYHLGGFDMATNETLDPPAAEAPRDATSDALLRELPVELVCELGRVSMSGRELLELRPGAVIPVGRPLAGPVDLTVGGRVVARGELVDVEGEIGVRVTQLAD